MLAVKNELESYKELQSNTLVSEYVLAQGSMFAYIDFDKIDVHQKM